MCPILPEKRYKLENPKGAEGIACLLFILLCELIGLSLEFTVGCSSRAVSRSGKKKFSDKVFESKHITGFRVYLQSASARPHTLSHIQSHAKEANLPQHTMRSNFNHLFQTYMSGRNLSSLARQSSLSYASASVVPTSPLSIPSMFHLYCHHTIYH